MFSPYLRKIYETNYLRADEVDFVEDSLNRPYSFKFFKDCLPQNFLSGDPDRSKQAQ